MRIVPSHFVPSRPPAPMQKHAPSRLFPRLGAVDARSVPASDSWPICLADSVVVPSGGEQVFRSDAFLNNAGRPIEFHSLRAVVTLATGAPITGVNGGGIIGLNIAVDGVPMTRGVVPIWGICRSDNRTNEFYLGSLTSTFAFYFANPMPLGVGKTIAITAQHFGVIPQSATVNVALAGRISAAPVPRRIPYVAGWSSRIFGYAEAATDSSPASALVNDTKRDLHVSRIIGRSVAYDDSSGAGAEYRDFDDLSLQGETSFLVRLTASQNRPVLRTYTPWRGVFGQNATVETDFTLKPGDFLIADVKHIAGPVITTPFVYSQNHGELSIVGWREV